MSRHEDISKEEIMELVSYDPETGEIFRRIDQYKGIIETNRRTGKSYRKFWLVGKSHMAHRLIWLYMTGNWPSDQIDHIDGNGLNNIFENLRAATAAENSRNQRRRYDNITGQTGVAYHITKKKYTAQIWENGKQVHLGFFSNFSDAVRARKSKEVLLGYHQNHGTVRSL